MLQILNGVWESRQKLLWRPGRRTSPKAELAAKMGGGFPKYREPRHVHIAYVSRRSKPPASATTIPERRLGQMLERWAAAHSPTPLPIKRTSGRKQASGVAQYSLS